MRASYEHIDAAPELSWRHLVRRASLYSFDWHFHPEFELTLITKGRGTRFVGDAIEEYESGDLVLLGSELPHAYASNPGDDRQEAIIVQFRADFLGAGLFERPEFATVRSLLDRARRGLHFPRSIPVEAFAALDGHNPARRTLGVLDTLVGLADCRDAQPLASEHHNPSLDRVAGERINAIFQFLHAEYRGKISLSMVADVAHMAPAAVSRFFRRTSGRTITNYLNVVRVTAACQLLVDTDQPVVDIALECGFQNLSNFNRRFRLLKGMAPREYRAEFRRRGRNG